MRSNHDFQSLKTVVWRVIWLCLLLAAPALSAHPICMMYASALVHRDRIDLKIQVMPEDFMLKYGLFADAQDRISRADIEQSAEKHKKFLLGSLVIRDADGNALSGRITSLVIPTLPAQGLVTADLMSTSVTYGIEYPLLKPPTHLTFQETGGQDMPVPAILTLTVTREGLPPEPDLTLSGEGNVETVAIDWSEASRPATGDYAERKAREEQKSRQEMGITSYAATYTFIYIQNEEVRVEILMPLLTLETWLPIARTNKDFLEVTEQEAARTPIEKFFRSQNEMKIDGLGVKPELDRLDFFGVDFTDFALRPAPHRLSAWTARVGVILSYPTKGAPQHVELKWTLFNSEMLVARAIIFSYDKGSRFTFLRDNPLFTWDNPGSPPLPQLTAVTVGKEPREAVAESLLSNVYRAFDYHSESDIYDALARSVQGDLLAELYLKIKQGLIMREQGGAVAQVKQVNVLKVEPIAGGSADGFSARVTWQVEGTVEHWGHLHTRINEYAADFAIAAVNGAWKIIGMQVNRQSIVRTAVSLQKLH
jgi:hypothetical protein